MRSRAFALGKVTMDESPRRVVCPARFEILSADAPPSPVTCQLSYDSSDPFAVTAHFTLGEKSVAWTFARSLLRCGVYKPVGEGDIEIHPGLDDEGHATVYVELCSPHGSAMLRTRSAGIISFLQMTHQVVPVGEEPERIDMDAMLSRLLHDDAAA